MSFFSLFFAAQNVQRKLLLLLGFKNNSLRNDLIIMFVLILIIYRACKCYKRRDFAIDFFYAVVRDII